MLEIAADYWPFSDQFQHLVNLNPFSMGQQSKTSDLKKTANQFLILIGLEQLHAACVIVTDLDTLHQIDYSFSIKQSG